MRMATINSPVYKRTCFGLSCCDSPCQKMIQSLNQLWTMHMSVYNMIEDHYKTSVMPTAIHLRTAEEIPMPLMRKATHFQIADFKFPHTFIICDRLLEPYFFFVSTSRNVIPYLIVWTQTKISLNGQKAHS